MNDEDFLLWIAHRLVNKYGEPRSILDRTIKIVSKNRTIKNTSLENMKNNTIVIDNIINYLNQLQKTNHNDINITNSENPSFLPNNTNLLDTIDIESFLK